MKLIKVLVGLTLGLGGCKSIEEAHQQRDDAKCLSYGVLKGSQPYVECRMQLEQQRSDRNRALMSSPATIFFVNSQ